jgi:hypothetical protein
VLYDDDVRPALFTMSSIVVGVGTLKVAVSPPISNLNMVEAVVSYASRLPSPLRTVLPAENQPENRLLHVDELGDVVVNRRCAMVGGGDGDGRRGGGDVGGGNGIGGNGGDGDAGGTMYSKA